MRRVPAPVDHTSIGKSNHADGSKNRWHPGLIADSVSSGARGIGDGRTTRIFDGEERLKALSAAGDPLERLSRVVDFEVFRGELEATLSRSDRSKGGRPPYDPVMMFKVLVLQTLYTLSDEQTEYQLKDRLSFMRFIGLALHDAVPDAKTIWLFREQLARAGVVERLFARFDELLRAKGWLAMGGQIVDATVIEARRLRLTQRENTPDGST